jgi:hypothetical protein
MNESEVRIKLAEACKQAGSQRKLAVLAGLSAPYIHDVIHGRREPGHSILRALGLRKIVSYEPDVPATPVPEEPPK